MENKQRHCYMCRGLERYYVKETKRLRRADFGWCCYKRENVEIHGCCDWFATRTYYRKSDKVLKIYLNDLLTEINELRCIIEEEQNEKKESSV